MPIYQFKCVKCGRVEERILTLREREEQQKCECGAALQQLISRTAFTLKGRGFHLNDYPTK